MNLTAETRRRREEHGDVLSNDFAWLTEHSREICEKYTGKWIAVLNGEVVGVGETATEAARQAETDHPGAAYLLESVDPEPERV